MSGFDYNQYIKEFNSKYSEIVKDNKITVDEYNSLSPEDQKKLTEALNGNPEILGDTVLISAEYSFQDKSLKLYYGRGNSGDITIGNKIKDEFKGADHGLLKDGEFRLVDKSGKTIVNADGIPVKFQLNNSIEKQNHLPLSMPSVRKEVRQFLLELLKKAYSEKNAEFNNYLIQSKPNFFKGLAMQLHDWGSMAADKLTEMGVVIDRNDTRWEIKDKLIDKLAEIEVLEDNVDNEATFNDLFKQYFHSDFDYNSTYEYLNSCLDFKNSEMKDKLQISKTSGKNFSKTFDKLTKNSFKAVDDYMGNAENTGGLLDLAFNVALMYLSGGSSAIAKYAQTTAKGGAELAENVITKVAGAKAAQSTIGKTVSQGVGIVSAQTTSAGANAVAFQVTKAAELAGEAAATGHVDMDKANVIAESAEGLFKFGYVGGAISGPLGMQVKGLTTKLLNSKPIINQILTKGITNKPTALTSVLKDISEHSEAIGEVLKFGTEFGINAGYMAYDDGTSYTDAMKNLAQMDGVSKMVIAMLGGKNLEFLTPKKVQQIKTDLAGYKVNIAIYEGQKVYSVKDAKGKETILATPEELFMFILDKEAQKVGVKAEHSNADNTPHPNTQEAREQSGVRTEGTKKPYIKPNTAKNNYTMSEPLLASEVTTKTAVPKIDNILDKVFDETTIPKTKAILEEMGLTKEEIASIDLKDSNKQRAIEALNNALKYMPKLKMEITKDEILSLLTESNDEITTFLSGEAKFFTDDNCNLLAKHVIFDESGELNKILDSDNNPQVVLELLPVLTQKGKHKLLGSELHLLGYFLDNPNNVAKITPENVDLLYKINEKIESKNYALELSDILNFENTTPEFVDNYVKEANRFAKFGLENFSEKDLQERINKRKAVSDFLEEYPIDVTTYDYINKQNAKLSGSNVYQLSQYSNKAEVQKFVNSLIKEARTQYCDCAGFIDKGFSTEKLANLLNEAAKNDFGEIKDGIYNLLNKMVETGSKDYNSMVDLVMAYKGTACLAGFDYKEYVQVANGDFKGAAKYVELAKELKMNPEHYKDLILDKDADFNVATSNLAYVKENGIDINLYDRYTLLRDNKFKINNEKIKYLEAQGITRLDDMYCYINKEFESDISVEEFKAKFEYINEFIAKNKNTDFQELDSDYFKVKFANNDLTINQVKELYNITQNNNFKPFASLMVLDETSNLTLELSKKLCANKDFSTGCIVHILSSINQDNIAFAEKLCADKDFPKYKIAEIIRCTTQDNLAFAEKLCADKDFPKDRIANIIRDTNQDNLTFAEKLCADKDFPKDQIADIISSTDKNNIAFAEKLCADKDFPKDQIRGIIRCTTQDNLAFAEKLCADKDFPKDLISHIISCTRQGNIAFAEKLCADKDFPKDLIANIISCTRQDNIAFAEKLCADKDFPKDLIANIIRATNKDNLAFAEKLCADKDFPKDKIADIIKATNKDNQAFLETLCVNENVPKDKIHEILKATVINDLNDAGGNNGKTDAKKVDRYTRLFQNPNTAKWAGDMLKQGFDIETISKLAPTKQSFFTERVKSTETTHKVVEEKAVSPIDAIKQETIQEFENLGLDTKQANAVFKSIAKNGVVDTSLKAKAIELINKGVAKNKIGDILNSAQITGEFNSKIVDDFVLLQNRGLNPLLEKNLAVLNNISGADCAVKFNSKVRNQIKAMINNLPDAVKISLKEQGIEIDSILKKLDSQVVRTSNNVPTRAKVESGFRSKAKITGFERIVVDKYEPNEQVWRNEDATKKWAEEKYLAFKNREYVSTRNTAEDSQLGEKVTQKRKEVLKEWYDFMETDENIKNSPFVKVILCDFITKELEPERSTTPPALNKDVVKQILGEAANSSNFSFSNAYAKKMKELSAKNSQGQQVEVNGRKGTWYTVPKTDSSSSDFKANAAKIRAFSDGTNWCIRTWNAEPYVQRGAMHFFVDENGLTQICIREDGAPGSVYEIQKRQQDQSAPVAYLDVIQSYMKEHELKPQSYCQGELDKAIKQKPEYDKLKSELDVLNNKKDYKGILEKMGITVTILPDGTFELSHYTSYIDEIALNDFGINENELLANVSRIKGNANFKDSNATTLPNLSEVGGILDFGYANISNIKNLKSINGQEIKWQ